MKKLFTLLSLLIGVLLFCIVIEWVGWKEIKEAFFVLLSYKGLVILALTVSAWLVAFWRWRFILSSQGHSFSFFKLGEIFFAGQAVIYFFQPPAYFGSEILRAYAAEKNLSVPREKSFASIFIERILATTAYLVFLILGVVAFLFLTGLLFKDFLIIIAILIGLAVAGLTVFYLTALRKKSVFRILLKIFRIRKIKDDGILKKVEREISLFFDFRKAIMWKGLSIALLRSLLLFLRCWFLVFFLRGEMGILVPLVVMFFLNLSYLFPLPAGLGILETTQVFAFGSLGLGAATGVAFSFVIRGTEIVMSLFSLVLLIRLGMKLSIKNIEKYSKHFT